MLTGTARYRELSSTETLVPTNTHPYANFHQHSQNNQYLIAEPRIQLPLHNEANLRHNHDISEASSTQPGMNDNSTKIATSKWTRNLCVGGLVLSTIIGIALVAAGAADRRQDRVLQKPYVFKELVPLGLNLIVVICTESLGYIHAKTQQWSLWEENRLEFNTNIRLFSYARRSWANGVVLSTLSLLALTMSYTSTSAILLSEDHEHDAGGGGEMVELSFSRAGPICLGISLLVQALICFVGLRTTRIKTWSSHPLLNAMVVRDQSLGSGGDGHKANFYQHHIVGSYAALRQQGMSQPSAFRFHRSVRTMLWTLGVTLLMMTIWMSVVLWDALRTHSGSSWALLPIRGGESSDSSSDSPWVVLTFFTVIPGREMRVLAQIALTLVIQLFVTVGLHISELAVLLSRDEDAWRGAAGPSSHGADIQSSSFLTVLKSWKSLALLLFKPVIHWMYGLAMYITYDGLVMMAPQLVYLIGLWLLLILFVLFLSFKKPPGGLQPATYGHLPTLVELLHDCRRDSRGRLFWIPKMEDSAYDGGGAAAAAEAIEFRSGTEMVGSGDMRQHAGLAGLWVKLPFNKPPNARKGSGIVF